MADGMDVKLSCIAMILLVLTAGRLLQPLVPDGCATRGSEGVRANEWKENIKMSFC